MTPELYWYAVTETIRYYVSNYVVPYFVPIIVILVTFCVAYTYIVNRKRSQDDPQKRDYRLWEIAFAPILGLLFLSLGVLVFIVGAFAFAIFLGIMTVLVAARRKPFVLVLWHKFATMIGEPILKFGARLFRMAFGR